MIMAQALQRHALGRSWRIADLGVRMNSTSEERFKDILRWFVDEPRPECPLSLHRIVRAGVQFGKLPGEWYGPNEVSNVLMSMVNGDSKTFDVPFNGEEMPCTCVRLREQRKQMHGGNGSGAKDAPSPFCPACASKRPFVVCVQHDAVVYKDQVIKMCSQSEAPLSKDSSDNPHSWFDHSDEVVLPQPPSLIEEGVPDKIEVSPVGRGHGQDDLDDKGGGHVGEAEAAVAKDDQILDDLDQANSDDDEGFNAEEEALKKIKALKAHMKRPPSLSSTVGAGSSSSGHGVLNDPLLNPRVKEPLVQWTKAVLILIPVRLGLDRINLSYSTAIQKTFEFPQSVGIIGGRRGHSTYFVGLQGGELLLLDPHTTQVSTSLSGGAVFPTPSFLSSVRCTKIRHMKMADVDPSLAFGFYCRSKEEFDDFCFRVEMMHKQCECPLFSIMDMKPKYSSEMVDDCASFSVDDDLDDDDDEFVLIAPVSPAERSKLSSNPRDVHM
jgi:hypothetical protein